MAAVTTAHVRKQIAAEKPDAIYVLLGEDDFEKSALAREFEDLVDEGLRAFNVDRIHAGDMTTGDKLASGVAGIAAAVRTLPMMVPRRVVVVPQADALFSPKRESEAASRAVERLEDLLAHPEPHTTLVFVVTTLDRRSRIFKVLAKHATLVECGVLEDQADAERWVRTRVAAAGMEIQPPAARLLASRTGTDVKRLRNDVERLLLYALGQRTITGDDVREIAGPAALQDDWAMTNALESGDTAGALRQLALLMDSGAVPEKVLGQIAWLVRTRFPATALRQAVGAVFRTDLDLKRSAGEPRVLLERLVVELCAGRRGRPMAGRG
jgi:DNA polymerase-3 subunit delta